MRYLGIDVGSSSIKGGVLNLDTASIERLARRPFPDPLPGLPAGHFEIELAAVVENVRQILDELLPEAPGCQGILFCSQMAGLILVDRAGRPLTNYQSWRDQRVIQPGAPGKATPYDELIGRLSPRDLQELGHELKPGSATCLLFDLARRGALPAAPATPLTICDYIILALCGGPPATEYTQALGTLNLTSGDWHRLVFEKLGIDGLAWPRLLGVLQPAASYRYQGREIPCHPGIGDQQSALAGVAFAEGELSINVSTGSQVSMLTPRPRLGANYQTRPFFDGQYLNTITHIPAGRSLNVMVDLLGELARAQGTPLGDPWPYIIQAAAESDDAALAVDVAFYAGPTGNRGVIDGITTDNLRVGPLFRAAFQNMAANYETCALRIDPDKQWSRIVFSGGLVQKIDLLRELILARLGAAHRLCENSEETLTGLLVLAGVAAGRSSTVAESARRLHAG